MTPRLFMETALLPALGMLPSRMDSDEARAMILAIGLQESNLEHRQQIGGPAHGYLQFERSGGVTGVLTHPASSQIAKECCARLDVDPTPVAAYMAIVYNDVLACIFGRLLLWTSPMALPRRDEPNAGWLLYLSTWRPGAAKEEAARQRLSVKWSDNFWQAWHHVVN